MAISEAKFEDLCDMVARIDERTESTASGLHELTRDLQAIRIGPCARGQVHEQRLTAADQEREKIWQRINSIPTRLIAVITVTVAVMTGLVGLIVILRGKI